MSICPLPFDLELVCKFLCIYLFCCPHWGKKYFFFQVGSPLLHAYQRFFFTVLRYFCIQSFSNEENGIEGRKGTGGRPLRDGRVLPSISQHSTTLQAFGCVSRRWSLVSGLWSLVSSLWSLISLSGVGVGGRRPVFEFYWLNGVTT